MATVSSSLEPGAPEQLIAGATVPAFTGIKRVQRVQEVREQLEAAIERGDFKPGDKLPSERELVEMLGVSRITVREALRSLEAVGWVEVHHGRGCFVVERVDSYRQGFARWLAVHREELLELLRVRGALDGVAAETAAERRDPEALASLQDAHEAFANAAKQSADDLDLLCELDIAFHEAIAQASGSALVMRLLRELNRYLAESRMITLAPPGRPARSAREHAAIVEAIVQGRPRQARSAVVRHLAAVREPLVDGDQHTVD
ncbi:MAG TPA: FadR/GntR family transcriptional regulator [Gaiellaceae bacterium]|nr:FadR/GntR family transcriptional regulator [Gaiellaceae bacterium]